MNNELFNVINDILKQNQSIITNSEPEYGNSEDILIKCFREEQKSKVSYQPLLILGLMMFLILQLICTNYLYINAIMNLLSIDKFKIELAANYFDLYNNILKQLTWYTSAVLGEFIIIFSLIVKWGFNSTITDLFSGLFAKKGNRNKNKKKASE